MEPIATFQGLATGINFRDVVSQIIEAESRPVLLMAQKRVQLDRRVAAWEEFRSRVSMLGTKADALASGARFDSYTASTTGAGDALSVSASSSAVPGSYAVDVLQLATHEKVGSGTYVDRTSALGLTGEFLIGGRAVSVTAEDSLNDVALAINLAKQGARGSNVSAAVVGSEQSGYRIVLTADRTGAAGVDLSDGSAGVLESLGFVDSTTSVKRLTSDGALSDGLSSSTADVATLLGLTAPPPTDTVMIGALAVAIDLSSDSLSDIATAINTAAAGAGSPISAQIVEDTAEDGSSVQRLDISGTTSFTDASGILETLGVVEAGRSAITQQVQGAAFTDGDGATVATGSTRLTDLWAGGASAGVQTGDTLTLSGTRGDGTTFTKTFTVGASSSYQDLVDALNDAGDGYGAGTRTATASIVDGRLAVTDDVSGYSQLSLSAVTNNEGGGSLDFGSFATVTAGRTREITAGRDAQLLVDGVFHTRSSNTVSDMLDGVTLTLSDVTDSTATVEISQDVDAIVGEISSFIRAFNSVSEFVVSQFTGAGADDANAKPPLSGENLLRSMRARMRDVLESTLPSTVSSFTRLAELGIEVNRNGTYDVDDGALREAVLSDPSGARRVFAEYGTSTGGSLRYLTGGSSAKGGSYDVNIATVATRAGVSSSGFGGTYVDDGTPDVMTLTEGTSGSIYEIELSNGMTLEDIVEALNAELSTATRRTLQAASPLHADALGTVADESTLLQDLHDAGGADLGVANGDVFTISGLGSDGTSFFREWSVTDISTQSLGDLRKEIAEALGTDVVVDVRNGVLTATAVSPGSESFALTVTSDNAGGGTFSFGSISATEEGRQASSVRAEAVGGELVLTHDEYGSEGSFTIAFAGGGTDGSASLGLAAGSYAGVDVEGTIGGVAGTGVGRLLTGAAGSDVDGIVVQYTGTAPGAAGSVTFSTGIASLMEAITDTLLDAGDGSIQGLIDRIDTQKGGIDSRIERFDARMDLRAANMIKRFTALEEAMAKAQNQLSWMQAQLGSLLPASSSNES